MPKQLDQGEAILDFMGKMLQGKDLTIPKNKLVIYYEGRMRHGGNTLYRFRIVVNDSDLEWFEVTMKPQSHGSFARIYEAYPSINHMARRIQLYVKALKCKPVFINNAVVKAT